MQTRLTWIDAAKGIGIIGVVAAHSPGWPGYQINFLYSYNALVCVSIFFFIAGYLFNVEKYINNWLSFIKSRVNQLIVPLYFFVLLSCLFQYIFFLLTNKPILVSFWNYDILTIFVNLVQINLAFPAVFFKFETLWFPLALFICEIVFYIIFKKITKNPLLLGIIIFSSAIPVLILYHNIPSPFWFAQAIVGMGLYFLGYIAKKYYLIEKSNFLVFFGLFLLFVFFGYDSFMSIASLNWKNIYYWYIGTISGIFFVLILVYNLYNHDIKSKILEFYGRNSLIIMILNILILYLVENILNLSIFGIFKPYILILITLIIFIPIIIISNKFFPWIVGKGNIWKTR